MSTTIEELLTAVGIGRVIGDAGLVVGANWADDASLKDEKTVVRNKRPRFVFGFDVRM